MNARNIMSSGHQMVLSAVDRLPEDAWHVANVCGVWSTKDIVAHLTSFEQVLVDVFGGLLSGGRPTPMLDQLRTRRGHFSDDQVAARREQQANAVLAEYTDAHREAMDLAKQLPDYVFPRPGTILWYGPEYALDDFIVYSCYGHKREHCAQIKVFRRRQDV